MFVALYLFDKILITLFLKTKDKLFDKSNNKVNNIEILRNLGPYEDVVSSINERMISSYNIRQNEKYSEFVE